MLSIGAEQEAGEYIHEQRTFLHRWWWYFLSVRDHGYCFECVGFASDAVRVAFTGEASS